MTLNVVHMLIVLQSPTPMSVSSSQNTALNTFCVRTLLNIFFLLQIHVVNQ